MIILKILFLLKSTYATTRKMAVRALASCITSNPCTINVQPSTMFTLLLALLKDCASRVREEVVAAIETVCNFVSRLDLSSSKKAILIQRNTLLFNDWSLFKNDARFSSKFRLPDNDEILEAFRVCGKTGYN